MSRRTAYILSGVWFVWSVALASGLPVFPIDFVSADAPTVLPPLLWEFLQIVVAVVGLVLLAGAIAGPLLALALLAHQFRRPIAEYESRSVRWVEDRLPVRIWHIVVTVNLVWTIWGALVFYTGGRILPGIGAVGPRNKSQWPTYEMTPIDLLVLLFGLASMSGVVLGPLLLLVTLVRLDRKRLGPIMRWLLEPW